MNKKSTGRRRVTIDGTGKTIIVILLVLAVTLGFAEWLVIKTSVTDIQIDELTE